MYRALKLKDNKVLNIYESTKPITLEGVEHIDKALIVKQGQLKQDDGTFIDDPEDLIKKTDLENKKKKQELIKLMHEANALRDDVVWQTYKDEYDKL